MANTLNFYSDAMCTTPAYAPPVGAVSIVGHWANLSNWTAYTYMSPITGKAVYIANVPYNNTSGIVCGGADMIDFAFKATVPLDSTPIVTDKTTQSGTNFYNALFINKFGGGENPYKFYGLQFIVSGYDDSTHAGTFSIRGFEYTQTPNDATPAQRTAWEYKYGSSAWHPEYSHTFAANTQFSCTKFGTCSLGGNDYYIFVAGVNASGMLNNTTGGNTMLFAVPREFFDAIPKPYVGPVSKDSAEAFTPTTPRRDSISSRDLTGKLDPYGFNTGNGTKLLVISSALQSEIVKQIYTGFSGDDLNALGQVVSGIVGGSTHRKAEEVQTMVNCILCCHIVPIITTGYTGGATSLYTLGGYQLFNPAKAVNMVTNQIVTFTTASVLVSPVVNNFLSFAPYAHVSLSVPFVGDIPVEPSALFGASVYFRFAIDLYTGTFSVDVHLVDSDGRDYIYATRQTNCAVDIPVMGTGANGNPLQKIASAAGNVASGGIASAPQAVYNVASAATDAKHSTVIGRAGSSNIAPYLSCRHCYLVITYPESANADNYFSQHGGVAHLGETVGTFRGTGYTEFEAVDVSGIGGATDAEKREIERVLKGGCFV